MFDFIGVTFFYDRPKFFSRFSIFDLLLSPNKSFTPTRNMTALFHATGFSENIKKILVF